jgi:hypothetical protein
MYFLKLPANSYDYQRQFGEQVELVKQFIEYYYYEREYSKHSHDRQVIVVKYGNDIFRIQKIENKFENWYNSKQHTQP